MAKLLKAIYHPNTKVAEFIADDGRHLLRSGGTLPWRINNCGDLNSPLENGQPAPKKTKNYVGFAKPSDSTHHFFIFPDYETGRQQLRQSLKRKHSQHCIAKIAETYAPRKENNTDEYSQKLLKKTGISPNKELGTFSDAELESLIDSIETLEGYHNETESRKEIWVTASTITATDGARPIEGAEIVLKVNGKQKTLLSNSTGQFPPIAHQSTPIEIHHKSASGELKKVGVVQGEQGKDFSLISRVRSFFGSSALDKKPEGELQSGHKPFVYVVQPGDTLGKIAATFRVAVAAIKADNNLTSDKIFPGDSLAICGRLTTTQTSTHRPKTPARRTEPTKTNVPSLATTVAPEPATTEPTVAVRSDDGKGAPLALMNINPNRVPWMKFAIEEAKRHKGATEEIIEKTINYHTEIKDGRTGMVGTNNAWCAAFVNWCLMKAGYPIENLEFFDHKAEKSRASAFYEVRKEKEKGSPFVRNPLFVQIDVPIYGAIAQVTSSSGHGHHVGFVFAKANNGKLILLGGNQDDRIQFSQIKIKTEKDYLRYFVPAAYSEKAMADQKEPELAETNQKDLNAAFGISTPKEEKAAPKTR